MNVDRIKSEVERFLPEVLGVIITDENGLPVGYSFSPALKEGDPIVVSGLISAATSMMENVMRDLANSSFELLFAQGNNVNMIVGRVDSMFLGIIVSPSARIGTLFMEFKRVSNVVKDLLSDYIGG